MMKLSVVFPDLLFFLLAIFIGFCGMGAYSLYSFGSLISKHIPGTPKTSEQVVANFAQALDQDPALKKLVARLPASAGQVKGAVIAQSLPRRSTLDPTAAIPGKVSIPDQLQNYLSRPQVEAYFDETKRMLGENTSSPVVALIVSNRLSNDTESADALAAHEATALLEANPRASIMELKEVLYHLGSSPERFHERQLLYDLSKYLYDSIPAKTSSDARLMEEFDRNLSPSDADPGPSY